MVDLEPREVLDRPDRERGAAERERRVDSVFAVAGDRDAQIARDRQIDEPVPARVGAQDHDRVGVVQADALVGVLVVTAEQEHGRRVREQQSALIREHRRH